MRDADHRTNEQILESLRSNPLVSYFSNALIDEVRFAGGSLFVDFLTRSQGAGNQRSRVLFAGDEFQVLNQSNFEWSKFGRLYQQKSPNCKINMSEITSTLNPICIKPHRQMWVMNLLLTTGETPVTS